MKKRAPLFNMIYFDIYISALRELVWRVDLPRSKTRKMGKTKKEKTSTQNYDIERNKLHYFLSMKQIVGARLCCVVRCTCIYRLFVSFYTYNRARDEMARLEERIKAKRAMWM